jgi:hypothetical protein
MKPDPSQNPLGIVVWLYSCQNKGVLTAALKDARTTNSTIGKHVPDSIYQNTGVPGSDLELKLVDEFCFQLANSRNAQQHSAPNELFATHAETYRCGSNSFANHAGQLRDAVEWLFDKVYQENYRVLRPAEPAFNVSSTLA